MQRTGIVIPAYGRPEMLKKCLSCIPEGYPVYVIDDCTPPDKGAAEMESTARLWGARYYRRPKNKGFAATANFGIQKAVFENILLLNTDVFLQPHAIEILLEEFEDPYVGIASPMLVFPPDSEWGTPDKIQHVGMAVNIMGDLIHLFIGWSPTNGRAVQRRKTNYVTGACMLLRREIWVSLGGFPEVYGRGTYEDAEFCIRARTELKKEIVMNPAAVGIHCVGQSAKLLGGYPLNQNREIFRLRCGKYIRCDDFMFL